MYIHVCTYIHTRMYMHVCMYIPTCSRVLFIMVSIRFPILQSDQNNV
jgi:hypothetical protein